jgi:demethylmenaquinone methyltransferase/2-methoxy-6-polyprenyl-1,4-benzoquinol methylase
MTSTENNNNNTGDLSNWFGRRPVDPAEKTGLVGQVFDRVAPTYDVMNDAMSLGIHRLWKRKFVARIKPRADLDILDMAGGTGDISRLMIDEMDGDGSVTVCDINHSMLMAGREKLINAGYLKNMRWVVGSAETVPLPDNSVDVYTIAFGLRNVTHIKQALVEAVRVLRPGGRFYCLEFSQMKFRPLNALYRIYSEKVIPRLGDIIANDADSYQYLIESIEKFPDQMELKNKMLNAGFDEVRFKNLSAGIAAIHEGFLY